MAARFTGDVSCFATSAAAHPVPAHEVAIRCEFGDGLARDRDGFGGFFETALATSAWKRGEPGTPARLSTGLQSVRRCTPGGVTQRGLTQPGQESRCFAQRERLACDASEAVVGCGPWVGSHHTSCFPSCPVQGTDSTIGRGAVPQSPFQHEFLLCVNTTINFRQPSCPLDFGSGGMEYHQRRRFLLKPIEETAQCIVTIPD